MQLTEKQEHILKMLVELTKTENVPTRINWDEFLHRWSIPFPMVAKRYLVTNFLVPISDEGHIFYSWKTTVDYPTRRMAAIVLKDLHLDNETIDFAPVPKLEPSAEPVEIHELFTPTPSQTHALPLVDTTISTKQRRVIKYHDILMQIYNETKEPFYGRMSDLRKELSVSDKYFVVLFDRKILRYIHQDGRKTLNWVGDPPSHELAELMVVAIRRITTEYRRSSVVKDRKITIWKRITNFFSYAD